MTCRRKTKTERELVADIKKAHDKFCCKHRSCRDCKYGKANDCRLEYVKELIDLIEEDI